MTSIRSKAFSLLETVLALSLLSCCALSILVVLLSGIKQSEGVRDHTIAVLLMRQLRTRLLDPSWPDRRSDSSGGWKSTVYFDASGALVGAPELAAYSMELTGGPGLAFESPRIESIEAHIFQGKTDIETFVLQRLRALSP